VHREADTLPETAARALEYRSAEHAIAHVSAIKLMVDTAKWRLAKLMPEQYGDRVQVEHGGQMAVHVYVPDNERQSSLPGDTARIIDGTAQELTSDESPEMERNPDDSKSSR
jgi:hypothetical protein